MAITTATKTLSVTASVIATAVGAAIGDKRTVVVKNASATIYIGGSDVTTSIGMPIASTDSFAIDLGPGDELYAIASSGTPTVNVLVTRV